MKWEYSCTDPDYVVVYTIMNYRANRNREYQYKEPCFADVGIHLPGYWLWYSPSFLYGIHYA